MAEKLFQSPLLYFQIGTINLYQSTCIYQAPTVSQVQWQKRKDQINGNWKNLHTVRI